ncbi:MAG: isocitrate/isopropylmalate dehydrogenase family protein [Deltaproteobacteria bacterium]|jgi:isocitrate/isopropylmalate dehydrogenase|nr:isocitrate/isopropylmalate dehydrogenase family protein [Deltaproteobacteria bacterium]
MTRAAYTIVALPGDGAGAEVTAEALKVLAEVGRRTDTHFAVEEIPCGGQYFLAHGRDWPEGSEEKCKKADAILLGAVGWPSPTGPGPVTMPDGRMAGWSPVIGNRTLLDLYANVRPVKLYPGVQHRISGKFSQVWSPEQVDMVILRENTEGLYSGSGGILKPGGVSQVATDTRVITRRASERIIKLAFETARQRNGAPRDHKKRVTAVVKNNVLYGCRFFTEVFTEIGAAYPDVEKDIAIVDAFTQWLVTEPERYDVVVTTNMFGDIVTDLAAVLQGGMGMAVGCNVGDDHGMFEPIHGSAPTLKKGQANPMAMLLATGEALKWLGRRKADETLQKAGRDLEAAVRAVVVEGKYLTFDLVGPEKAARTDQVTDAILNKMA